MRKAIDLHIHTTASDGTASPGEAVSLASEMGLAAIAITDHDTADGVAEAMARGAELGLEVIPGIELSIDYKGEGVHILAYYIDPEGEHIKKLLDWVIWERERRNAEIVEAMRADGIEISLELIHERFPDAIIGRPHFAAMLAEKGLAENVDDGFRKYLNRGGRYYRKRQYIPMDMAFDTLKKSGAVAVMAHPFQYRFADEELEKLVEMLKSHGLWGMECIYSLYIAEETEKLRALAERFGLGVTGGSDYHGSRKPHIQMGSGCGDMFVPYEFLENMKKLLIK